MHPGPLGDGDLRGEMGRAPESVDPEPAPRGQLGLAEGPVADDPGTEKRRGLLVGERRGNRVRIAFVDDRVRRVASVEVPAGEERCDTEVLAPVRTEPARPTGMGQ